LVSNKICITNKIASARIALSILDLNCTPPPEEDLNIPEEEEDDHSQNAGILYSWSSF
jgi:hypothetical protein